MNMFYQFIYELVSKYGKYVQSKGIDVQSWRQGNMAMGRFISFLQPMPSEAKFDDAKLGGVDCFYVQAPQASKKVILYLHGGGYIFGLKHLSFIHKPFAANLALKAGADVWVPDYRLVPEHSASDALEDVLKAYEGLLEKGYLAKNIHIVGDSAGGGLALSMMFKLREQKKAMPANLSLVSAWTDMLATGETMESRAAVDHQFHTRSIREVGELVISKSAPNNRDHSPLYGDFTGLPPILFIVGNDEVLLDDSRRVFKKAKAAGVHVDIEIYKGMFHVFPLYEGIYAQGKDAIRKIASFIGAKQTTPKRVSRIA